MSRFMGIVCASALLVAVTGCSLDSFALSFLGPCGNKRVVAGSVDSVSARLQEGLSEVGIAALATRQDGEVRLVGVAKSGTMFRLMLNRERTKGPEKTAITVRWDRAADEQFWRLVGKILEAPAPSSDNSPDLQEGMDRKSANRP